jgi:hypothetical protein
MTFAVVDPILLLAYFHARRHQLRAYPTSVQRRGTVSALGSPWKVDAGSMSPGR